MKKILVLISFLLTISCKSQSNFNKEVKYLKKGELYESYLTILNNRFEYLKKNFHMVPDRYSSGTIKKNGDSIFFQSDEKFKMGIIASKEEFNKSITGTELFIFNDESIPLGFVSVTINNDLELGWNTGKDGKVNIPHTNIESISIYCLSEEYHYKTKNTKSNSIRLDIRLRKISKKYFDNEIWTIKGRKLFSPDGETYRRSK